MDPSQNTETPQQQLHKESGLHARVVLGEYDINNSISDDQINQLQQNRKNRARKIDLKAAVLLSEEVAINEWKRENYQGGTEEDKKALERIKMFEDGDTQGAQKRWEKELGQAIIRMNTQQPEESQEQFAERKNIVNNLGIGIDANNPVSPEALQEKVDRIWNSYANHADTPREKHMERFLLDARVIFRDANGDIDELAAARNSEFIGQIATWAFGSDMGDVIALTLRTQASLLASDASANEHFEQMRQHVKKMPTNPDDPDYKKQIAVLARLDRAKKSLSEPKNNIIPLQRKASPPPTITPANSPNAPRSLPTQTEPRKNSEKNKVPLSGFLLENTPVGKLIKEIKDILVILEFAKG